MRKKIAIPVEDLQQWQLLVSVCPIFAHPHPWTATRSDSDDVSSVKTQARLFQGIIMEIPVHIPPGSIIPPEVVDALRLDLDDILTQLVRLVNDTHLTVPKPGPKELPEGSDKLWALKELRESNGDAPKPMEHYARYLNLTQDPLAFKRSGRAIERYVVCFSKISTRTTPKACGTYLQPPKANTSSPKSSFQSTFYQSSKHLFERLVTHLEPCHGRYGGRGNQKNNSKQYHQAMVHLNYSQSVIDGNFSPAMALTLQSCMEEHSSWHQIRCIISSSDRSSSSVNTDVVKEICQVAQEAYNTGRFFMVELRGDIFLDMSDDSESSRYCKDSSQDCAEPTKSMRDLLGDHILSPANYKTGFLPSDKKMLAFTVAHAILHLHPGPWIQSPLTLDNIFFLYDKSTHTIHNIHHPHISCTLA
ncbi:hypothetical protein QBC43DRAFT_362641 [Cladorrhinum sp. PSN259]|nr:hypothetical protein QBC43DRAFT_362641 [Cladorrhinum sp. PSN259]